MLDSCRLRVLLRNLKQHMENFELLLRISRKEPPSNYEDSHRNSGVLSLFVGTESFHANLVKLFNCCLRLVDTEVGGVSRPVKKRMQDCDVFNLGVERKKRLKRFYTSCLTIRVVF
jgi:hypothetical protein